MERFFLSHSSLGLTKPYPDRSAGRVGNFWSHIQQTPSQGILGMGLGPCHKKSSKRLETTTAYVAKKMPKGLSYWPTKSFPQIHRKFDEPGLGLQLRAHLLRKSEMIQSMWHVQTLVEFWISGKWWISSHVDWCRFLESSTSSSPQKISWCFNRARPLTANCRAVLQELLLRQIKGLVAVLQEKTPKSQA